jgi:hypothetical protein
MIDLDRIAASLKAEFPECTNEIERQLARMQKEQQELAEQGRRRESAHMLAVDFRAYVVNLPCAERQVAKIKRWAQKGAKKKRWPSKLQNPRF